MFSTDQIIGNLYTMTSATRKSPYSSPYSSQYPYQPPASRFQVFFPPPTQETLNNAAKVIQNAFRRHNAKKAKVVFTRQNKLQQVEDNLFLIPVNECFGSEKSGIISKNILELKKDSNFLPYFAYKSSVKLSDKEKVEHAKHAASPYNLFYICKNPKAYKIKTGQTVFIAEHCGSFSYYNLNLRDYAFQETTPNRAISFKQFQYTYATSPSIYVNEEYRRQGIGKTVLAYFLNSFASAISFTAVYNTQSLNAHLAAGFTCIGSAIDRVNPKISELYCFMRDDQSKPTYKP